MDNDAKSRYGFWIVLLGFVVVLGAFVFSVEKWPNDVKNVTAAMGSVTGVVGTLAGAYFGVHAGASGKDKAEAARDAAQQKVARLAVLVPPEKAEEAARALAIE